MKRKTLFISLLLVFNLTSNAQAGSLASWLPPQNLSPTYHSLYFADRSTLIWPFSVLQTGNRDGFHICKYAMDPNCAILDYYQYSSILKVCDTAAETDCIDSIQTIDADGKESSARFIKYTVDNHFNAYPAYPKWNIPAGGMPSIWDIPNAPNTGGTQYALMAGDAGEIDKGQTISSYLSVSLVPVSLKKFTKINPQRFNTDINYDYCDEQALNGTHKNVYCTGRYDPSECLLTTAEYGMCYQQESFLNSQRIKLNIRLAKEPVAWLHGRIVDPEIKIDSIKSGGVLLSVSASPTKVPYVYQGDEWSKLPRELQQFWVDCMGSGPAVCGTVDGYKVDKDYWPLGAIEANNAKMNLLGNINSFGPIPMSAMKAILPLIGDKAITSNDTWSFRTLSPSEMNGANYCFSKGPGVKGIVSTNSTAYSDGPPAFKDGILNYQVAAPHFLNDGSVFKGNYNLVIKSDVARCLYGFSKAPVNATISITSSDGTPQIATTVIGEKDGWLYLKANNFEFSSPSIQVKLTQDAPVINKPKIKQITCVKGKLTKVVTTTSCPAGYKKK